MFLLGKVRNLQMVNVSVAEKKPNTTCPVPSVFLENV